LKSYLGDKINENSYIFGAGASAAEGAPVVRNFLRVPTVTLKKRITTRTLK
jgi:hypothetical protein